jgi:hypothetical protein
LNTQRDTLGYGGDIFHVGKFSAVIARKFDFAHSLVKDNFFRALSHDIHMLASKLLVVLHPQLNGNMKKLLLALTATCLVNLANAAIVSADFKNTGDLPYQGNSNGPIVFQATGIAINSSVELNTITPISNPSSWLGGVVAVDIDPLTNILTLTAKDSLDFQTFLFAVTNIVFNAGENVTGFTQLTNNLVTPIYSPTLAFTGSSLSISYDTGTNARFNFINGSSSSFQITTNPATVPLPTSFALIAGGLLLIRRKQKR